MEQPRLTPVMRSRKTMVLDFVTAWIGAHPGSSPSYGEIAIGVGVSRQRVLGLIRQLETDGKILRRPGVRGLTLPSERDRAVRLLRELGARVDDDFLEPAGRPELTFSELPMLPALAQTAGGGFGGGDGGSGTGRGGAAGAAGDRGPLSAPGPGGPAGGADGVA